MNMFNFIKKIFKEPEKVEESKEKIAFSEIGDFVKNKIRETENHEKKAISLINQKVDLFTNEIREKIKIVNAVDIESKDRNDKMKSLVYEGRKKYVEFLERFIKVIQNNELKGGDDKTNLEKVIENINLAFLRFNENSGKSYERATILIGKEMGTMRDALKSLSKELMIIFDENRKIIQISKRLFLLESKMGEIKEMKEKLLKIDEEVINLDKKITEKEEESKEVLEKINKIKKSVEYLENIEKEKSVLQNEQTINEKILNLKQLIDFKKLSNFFHIFEDKMAIVKHYRDDFLGEFKKSGEEPILNLLNESKLNTDKIDKAIEQIHDKKQEVEKDKSTIKKDETLVLASELEKISEEINDLVNEQKWAEKKNEELKVSEVDIFKLIKDELHLMDVELDKIDNK